MTDVSDLREDLKLLVETLDIELDDRMTSVEGEYRPLSCLRGTELYARVQAVEYHYGGKLPVEPWAAWREMLGIADEGKGPSDEAERYTRYYEAMGKIRDWANEQTSGPEPIELPSEFTPTEPDIAILHALSQRQTRCKTDALAVTGAGQRTVAIRLLELERVGLVNRAAGKRSGWAITKAGRTLRATFAHGKRT